MWLGKEQYLSLVRSCKWRYASCSIVHSTQNLLNTLCKFADSFIRRPFKSPVGAGFMYYWTCSKVLAFLSAHECVRGSGTSRCRGEGAVLVHGARPRGHGRRFSPSAGLSGSVHADCGHQDVPLLSEWTDSFPPRRGRGNALSARCLCFYQNMIWPLPAS